MNKLSTTLAAFVRHRPAYLSIQTRYYSTTLGSSLIDSKQVPAPHVGHIQVLLLNRQAERNAINWALIKSLRVQLEEIASEAGRGPTRALVLGSTGPVFCAGADLKERKTFSQAETSTFLTYLNATFSLLSSLSIPTISAISTHAHGGGLELALTTDFRVVSPMVQLSLPETRLGIIPGAGGTYRLPRLIGRSRALDMMMTGRRVGAQEALNFGLVSRCCDEDRDVNEEAIELARKICEGGPLAITAVKRAVDGGWEGGLGVEGLAYQGVVNSEDKFEALNAFAEKRKPVFQGK